MRMADVANHYDLLAHRLPSAHPGRRLLAWSWDPTLSTDELLARIDGDAEVHDWLVQLDTPNDVHAALRWCLRQSPGANALPTLRTDDFRTGELVLGERLITAFYFAGAE
jgi:hypothetical protein